jgi:serine/threonine-protein kinase
MRPSSLPPAEPADRTLRDLLRVEGALSFDQAARLLTALTDDLASLHAAGRVHGAITPQAVQIDDDGLARLGPPAADPDGVVGLLPPAYLAPERIDGEPADARSDVYALGLVGWEMLAGETPFAGDSLREIVAHQHGRDLPRLTTLRPGVPRPLLFAIEGALHKQPDDRWANAGEMLAQLRQGRPTPAPASTASRAGRVRALQPVVVSAGRASRDEGPADGTRWGRRLSLVVLVLAIVGAGAAALVAMQGRADRTAAAPWLDSLTTSTSAGVLITKDTANTAVRLRTNRARVAPPPSIDSADDSTDAATTVGRPVIDSTARADSATSRPDSAVTRARIRPDTDTVSIRPIVPDTSARR